MTEPEPLPGLAVPDEIAGPIERAAHRTIVALAGDDQLAERDAVLCQSLLTLARQYDRAANSSKAKEYAIANLHAQVLATIAQLMPTEGGDPDDEWAKLEAEVQADIARRAAEAAARDRADTGPTD